MERINSESDLNLEKFDIAYRNHRAGKYLHQKEEQKNALKKDKQSMVSIVITDVILAAMIIAFFYAMTTH
jgi:hypothetical protein